jgi:hypothetical protein
MPKLWTFIKWLIEARYFEETSEEGEKEPTIRILSSTSTEWSILSVYHDPDDNVIWIDIGPKESRGKKRIIP